MGFNVFNSEVSTTTLKEKLEYYKKQSAKADKDYTRTGKLAERLVAIRYQGKVEILEELLK